MGVAKTILEQLGGNKFLAMTGAKNLVSDGNTLRMRLPRNGSKANSLWVTLNGNDLYDMRFFNYKMGGINLKTGEMIPDKVTHEVIYNDIFCDQLQEVFTRHTKMYTHL